MKSEDFVHNMQLTADTLSKRYNPNYWKHMFVHFNISKWDGTVVKKMCDELMLQNPRTIDLSSYTIKKTYYAIRAKLNVAEAKIKGCDRCNSTGYVDMVNVDGYNFVFACSCPLGGTKTDLLKSYTSAKGYKLCQR